MSQYKPTSVQYKYVKSEDAFEQADKAFEFSKETDESGVPYEHAAYIKKNCKHCYERGFVRGIHKENRYVKLCPCVTNGYIKFKGKFNTEFLSLLTKGVSMEEARITAAKNILS